MADLGSTKIYQSLVDCDPSFKIDSGMLDEKTTNSTSDPSGSVELWVDMWTHKPTKIYMNMASADNKDTMTLNILPQLDVAVTIDTPSSSVSLSELQTYIQDLMSSFYLDTPSYTIDPYAID